MAFSNRALAYLTFGIDGVPVAAQYAKPGGGQAVDANATGQLIPAALAGQIVSLGVHTRAQPAAADTIIMTVYINGVATAATVTITGANNGGTWNGRVTLAANDIVTVVFGGTIGGSEDVNGTIAIQRPI